MRRSVSLSWLILALASSLAALGGCEGEEAGEQSPALEEEDIVSAVPEGKADNYFSTAGREYLLMGVDVITPDDPTLTGEELQAELLRLVELRENAIAFFSNEYVKGKSSHDENAEYGDFRSTIRLKTMEALDPEPLEEEGDGPQRYSYLFVAELAGPNDLMSQLPLEADGRTFSLTLPVLSNRELSSGSYSRTYSHFDPTELDAEELTSLELEISPQDNEADSFPEYQALFADDLFDVLVMVGGDYNDERYDMEAAKGIFSRLQTSLKLDAPVDTFDELRSDSGPFTGELNVNGRPVRIEVYLIHPDMQKEEGVGYEGLKDIYRDAMASKDMIIYDGHAGYDESYSGVVVHYNPRHAIPAVDFRELEMPDRYQIVVFNGCKTYTQYADNLYANPSKSPGNLDIITTVNFSWLSEMTRITTELIGGVAETQAGEHLPQTYGQILADMNRGSSWNVIYGVHGVADNPHMSPYGSEGSLCSTCTRHSDCPGAGNLCLALPGLSERICGVACTADDGCPEGYSCREVSRGRQIIGSQCLPFGNSCSE